ncbi:MAG: hypothetical protein RDU83_13915, partial [bacterium]|nr:hypothetical protein [bacterium]
GVDFQIRDTESLSLAIVVNMLVYILPGLALAGVGALVDAKRGQEGMPTSSLVPGQAPQRDAPVPQPFLAYPPSQAPAAAEDRNRATPGEIGCLVGGAILAVLTLVWIVANW